MIIGLRSPGSIEPKRTSSAGKLCNAVRGQATGKLCRHNHYDKAGVPNRQRPLPRLPLSHSSARAAAKKIFIWIEILYDSIFHRLHYQLLQYGCSFVRSVGWLVNHKMQLKLSQERVSIAAICCPNIHTSNLDASGASVWVSCSLLVGSCAWTGCLLLH